MLFFRLIQKGVEFLFVFKQAGLFPAIRTGKLTVEVTQANGTVRLRDIRAYFAK